MTMRILSRTSYTLSFEVCMDGTTWLPFVQGKARKKK
jgi:hypothetical protein